MRDWRDYLLYVLLAMACTGMWVAAVKSGKEQTLWQSAFFTAMGLGVVCIPRRPKKLP